MQKTNIIINLLSARLGGGKTYAENIIPELSRSKDKIFTIIISSKYQKELIKKISSFNVKLFDSQIPALPMVRFLWEQLVLPFYLKKTKCDIFCQVSESCPLLSSCTIIIHAQNPILFLPWREIKSRVLFLKKFINLPIALISFKKADKIICVSEYLKQSIVNRYKVPQGKFIINYHGLSANFQSIKNKTKQTSLITRPYILSVSDFMPHKNYEVLIKEFYVYLKKNPDSPLELKIAGKQHKAYFSAIKKLAISYNLERKVHFMGLVDYEKLPQFYSQAEIFIFPSKVESFGIPSLEAMASGLPILASDIPVFKELCRDAAIYFEYNDPEDLAEKIQFLTDNPKTRKELAKKALKRSTAFSWKKTAAGLLRIFNEVK